MFWTLELASSLDDAPWPATKEELIDYATRTCAPDEVIENLEELDDDNTEIYESIEDIWPDYPTKEDFMWNRRHLAGLSHEGGLHVERGGILGAEKNPAAKVFVSKNS